MNLSAREKRLIDYALGFLSLNMDKSIMVSLGIIPEYDEELEKIGKWEDQIDRAEEQLHVEIEELRLKVSE